MSFLPVLAQAAPSMSLSTIIQGMMLGLFIIFCFTVFTVGFVAKKLDIYGASHGKALIAVILMNLASLPGLLVLPSMGVPPVLAFIIVASLFPIGSTS